MAQPSPASSSPGTPTCCCQAALTRQLLYGRQTLEFKCSESQLTRVHMWLYMIHLVTCQNVADTFSSSWACQKCTASPVVSFCICTQSAQACLHGSTQNSSYLLHASIMGTLLIRLDSVSRLHSISWPCNNVQRNGDINISPHQQHNHCSFLVYNAFCHLDCCCRQRMLCGMEGRPPVCHCQC